MFTGSCVALVTPFKNGQVDEQKLRELVEYQIANRTSGLVPCGTTGESATLSHDEHRRVIEIVIEQARKRVPVIAGTGSNSTAEAVQLTRHAAEAGADGALVIAPYYNKPTQQGMVAHFGAVAKSAGLPIVIYNIPGRTGVNLLPATLAAIADKNRNVVGVKESSGNLEQVTEVARLFSGRKNFSILSGDDSLTLPILSVGGRGAISVLANLAPRDVAALCAAGLAGKLKQAQALNLKMAPLIKALFIETNPAPLKTAMEILGRCSSEMRLPMVPLAAESRKALLRELKQYGLTR